ncbi:unnamed protein product [Discosporangium mesarthrocarpum]
MGAEAGREENMNLVVGKEYLLVGKEGLFPKPLDPSNKSKRALALSRFRLLGRMIGKSLKDGRMLDLPLSLPLCSTLVGIGRGGGVDGAGLGQGRPITLEDIGLVDESLGNSLEEVAALAQEVERERAKELNVGLDVLEGTHMPMHKASRPMVELEAAVENLCLTWTLPGSPWYELRTGGANLDVSSTDLSEWVRQVTRHVLVDGVSDQLDQLISGLAEVVDPMHLAVLSAKELQHLLSGEGGGVGGDLAWSYPTVIESIVCGHGYTKSSAQVQWLARMMAQLTPPQRRQFLKFVTGTPRLPVGGFAGLQPRLTVVRKEVPSGSADLHLPSCSTCQVYLKLPAYTSPKVLETKLIHAMTEGQDHFALD